MTKVIRKFYRDGVEYKIKFDTGWKPGANTIAYYPLTSTTTTSDMSGNGRTLSKGSNTATFGTYGGVSCVYVTGSSGSGYRGLYNTTFTNSVMGTTFTMSFWGNKLSTNDAFSIGNGGNSGKRNGFNLIADSSVTKIEVLNNGSINALNYSTVVPANVRGLYTATYDNGATKLYLNGELVASGTYTVGTLRTLGVGCIFGTETTGYTYQGVGYISEVILENKARTAQEISDYYNNTKSNYGL